MIEFVKMNGNGNDFIMVDNRERRFSADDLSMIARNACRRRLSLGADGILVVEPSNDADFTMRLFNADGSEGEMCGNGARCIARYALEKGIASESMIFQTLAGKIEAFVDPPHATIDMGRIDLSNASFGEDLIMGSEMVPSAFLTVGVPHLVLFLAHLERYGREKLVTIGRTLRNDRKMFPRGTNVNFVERLEDGTLKAVTYERGVEDLTESCGTGSTASALAAAVMYGQGSPVEVHNPGGDNEVSFSFGVDGKSCTASLRGRTMIVAEGVLTEEAAGL